MKKLIIALGLCLILIAVMAAPVMAAKPAFFKTRITSDGVQIPGDVNGNFVLKTQGVAGIPAMHPLGLVNTETNLNLSNVPYPFYLQADAAQQAVLKTYFDAKLWGNPLWYAKIYAEIEGVLPFFFVKFDGNNYTLVDGFIPGGDLRIDDDYPVGKYVYTGTLEGLPMSITLKVIR
jgi:hypothetical protein